MIYQCFFYLKWASSIRYVCIVGILAAGQALSAGRLGFVLRLIWWWKYTVTPHVSSSSSSSEMQQMDLRVNSLSELWCAAFKRTNKNQLKPALKFNHVDWISGSVCCKCMGPPAWTGVEGGCCLFSKPSSVRFFSPCVACPLHCSSPKF